MAEEGTRYVGGLVAAEADRQAGGYRNWGAHQMRLNEHITIAMVGGQVRVGNPGIRAVLSAIIDFNPNILMLRLDLYQRPGEWIQRETWITATYVAPMIDDGPWETCDVVHGEVIVVSVPFTG